MQLDGARTDVVVVGGGMAGLTAATYLARSGLSVAVLEKASALGGRASTQLDGGYAFNRGGHALYARGAAASVLQELQVAYTGGSPSGPFALLGGRLYPIPTSLRALLRTRLLGLRDKVEVARFFMSVPAMTPAALARVSAAEWIEGRIHRPRARLLVASLARTALYSASLDRASAEVLVERLQLALKGSVIYIDGGWQSLVDGLRGAAEAAGARTIAGARVQAVEHETGRVPTVRLVDGSALRARAVVVATGAQDAARLLGDAAPALRRAVDAGDPAEVACLDVALSRLPSSRYPVIQDLEHARFFSIQSLFARVAPPAGALIHTVKQLRSDRSSEPRQDEQDLEELLDLAEPGWRGLVVRRSFLPRIEAATILPTAGEGGLAGRPGHRVAGLGTIYLAGDWVGPQGYLLDAALASARRTAELVREDLRPPEAARRAEPAEHDADRSVEQPAVEQRVHEMVQEQEIEGSVRR